MSGRGEAEAHSVRGPRRDWAAEVQLGGVLWLQAHLLQPLIGPGPPEGAVRRS